MMLRMGLVGAGRIGNLHAGNIARHPRMRIVAVHDVDSARAKALATKHGGRATATLDELLGADIDAVVIASSTNTHAAATLAAARAGKAIYLEKPIDLDFREALRTADALRTAPVPIMVGFNRRYDAIYRALRHEVRQGALGRVQIVQMTSRGPNEAPTREYIEHSGGIYRDKSIHFFDLLRFLVGREVVEISVMGAALADAFIGDLGDVDTCVMQLRLDDGAFCQIDNTRRAAYGFDERVEIFATGGLRVVGRVDSPIVRADASGVLGASFPHGFMQRFEDAFARAIDGFGRFILDGDSDVPTLADGIAAQAIAEAAALSAREGRMVEVAQVLRDVKPGPGPSTIR